MFGWSGFVSGMGVTYLFGWVCRLWDDLFSRFWGICGDWGVWDSQEPSHGSVGPVRETWEGVRVG